MKKAIFKGFAVATLALAVLFTGCKNEPSNIETIRVDAVEITAKAYPGYNYVCWTLPEGYQSSKIMIIRDDGKVMKSQAAYDTTTTGSLSFVDTDIKDGVSYKYTAYVDTTGVSVDKAFTSGSGSTTISDVSTDYKGLVTLGNSSSASCKAINPVCIKDGKLMAALDLCEYEDGCDEDYIINADNIVFERTVGLNSAKTKFVESFDVAFPTKEYLTYTPKVYKGNALDTFGLLSATAETATFTAVTDNNAPYVGTAAAKQNFYTNDTAVRYNGVITGAGEYTLVVEVAAQNPAYSKSIVTASKKFTVEALDTNTNTDNVVAGYVDEGKKIRVLWTPATKSDTSLWAEDSYKVYVKDSYGVYTEIAPAKKAKVNEDGEAVEDDDGNVIMETTLPIAKDLKKNEYVYYIDYAVADNKIGYNFYVVLSDNGKFESTTNTTTASVANWDEITTLATLPTGASVDAGFYNVENDELTNDAFLKITDVNKNTTKDKFVTVTAKYKVLTKDAANGYLGDGTKDNNATDYAELWLDKEFNDAEAVTAADATRFDFIVKNVDIDSKVIWLYKVSKKDCKDNYFYLDSGVSALSSFSTGLAELSITDVERTDATTAQKVKFVLTPSETARANYTYKLYYAKVNKVASDQTGNKYPSYDTITDWTKVTENATFAWDKDTLDFRFTSAEITLDATTTAEEKLADDYATTGKKVAKNYADTYAIKLVKINKNAKEDAAGNAYCFYTTKAVTKDAK